MGRAIEGGDGDAADAFHEEALIEHAAQGLQCGRRGGEVALGRGGPELIHDDAVGHVHEAEAYGRARCGGDGTGAFFGGVCPAHDFEQGEREGGAEAAQAGAAGDEGAFWHGNDE